MEAWGHSGRQIQDNPGIFSLTSLDLSLVKCTQGGFCKLAKKTNKHSTTLHARTRTHTCAFLRSQLTYECNLKVINVCLFQSLCFTHLFLYWLKKINTTWECSWIFRNEGHGVPLRALDSWVEGALDRVLMRWTGTGPWDELIIQLSKENKRTPTLRLLQLLLFSCLVHKISSKKITCGQTSLTNQVSIFLFYQKSKI